MYQIPGFDPSVSVRAAIAAVQHNGSKESIIMALQSLAQVTETQNQRIQQLEREVAQLRKAVSGL